MNQPTKNTKAKTLGSHRLTKTDWILAGAVFIVSGIAAYFGLQFANLPMGYPAVVGLTPLCALAAALACAYLWQFDLLETVRLRPQMILLAINISGALVSGAVGIRVGGQSVIELLAHGGSANGQIEILFPWVWILGVALGATYLQLWTLVRYFFSRRAR